MDTQCSGADECKDKECCVDDGVTCASDDDCCGSSQCQDSGACGELAGCKANDDDCNDDSVLLRKVHGQQVSQGLRRVGPVR